jgi:hypothetical protein
MRGGDGGSPQLLLLHWVRVTSEGFTIPANSLRLSKFTHNFKESPKVEKQEKEAR